jgi:hypothetical protein
MKRTLTLGIPAVVLLASACGQSSGTSQAASPATGTAIGSCSATDAEVTGAPVVTRADLDGDGAAEDVRLTGSDAKGCAGYLVATVRGRMLGVPLGKVSPAQGGYSTVSVPGRHGQLLVVRETHPRGGFQNHLYGYAGSTIGEVLTKEGSPVLPFVTTDTKGGYLSVTCADNGLVVQQAVPHSPPGVAFAWDVEQKSYTLDGLVATLGDSREVKDNVLDADLEKDYPALVRREAFRTGCQA